MDAFDHRRQNEDFAVRLGFRQVGQFTAGDLERNIRLVLEIIGPSHGRDQSQETAQDTVMVKAGHILQQGFDIGRGRLVLPRRHRATLEAELDVEEIEQGFDNLRVFAQGRLLDIRTGVEARLDAIAAEGAQQGDLAPRLAGQGEGIETVVLGPAVVDGQQGLLELLAKIGKGADMAARQLEDELVHPESAKVGRLDAVAIFLKRLQAHIAEHRQDVAQGNGALGPGIELETEDALVIFHALVGAQVDRRLGAEVAEIDRVDDGVAGGVALLIAGGKGLGPGDPVGIGMGQGDLIRYADVIDQRLDLLRPGTDDIGDIGFKVVDVRVEVIAGRDADDVVNARQQGFGDIGIARRNPSEIGLGQDFARLFLHLRLVEFTRDVKQDADEAVERVGAGEQTDARPVGQVQNATGNAQQVLLAHLEQFIARIGFDDVLETLFVIAAAKAENPGLMEYMLGLLADQRHFESRPIIGFRSEQADETNLTRRLAIRPVPLDADVVHVNATVDARLDIGLGHRHRFGIFQLVEQLCAQDRRFGRTAQHLTGRIAQNAEAFLVLVERRLGLVLAIDIARIGVATRAQEDEMVLVDPTQEGEVFIDDRGIDAGGRIVTQGFQRLDLAGHQLLHARKVAHGQLEIVQAFVDAIHDLFVLVGGLALDEDLHHRLFHTLAGRGAAAVEITVRGDDGMKHRTDRNALVDQFAHHGLDDKRRVGLDDLDDIVIGKFTRTADQGLDTLQGLDAVAAVTIGPEAGDRLVDVVFRQVGQLIGFEILKNLGDEGFLVVAQPQEIAGADGSDKSLSELVLGSGSGGFDIVHGVFQPFSACRTDAH